MEDKEWKQLLKQFTPEEPPKTPPAKTFKERPRNSDTNAREDVQNGREGDYMSLLRRELSSPFLTLIEGYVTRCYPKNRSHSNKMLAFQVSHPRIFASAVIGDIVTRVIFLLYVILIAARGLGIIDIIGQLSTHR